MCAKKPTYASILESSRKSSASLRHNEFDCDPGGYSLRLSPEINSTPFQCGPRKRWGFSGSFGGSTASEDQGTQLQPLLLGFNRPEHQTTLG